MSDIMLSAVIQMPYEMAMKDELSRRQFYARANQALNERNAKEAEIVRLRDMLFRAQAAFQKMKYAANPGATDFAAVATATYESNIIDLELMKTKGP